MTAYMHIKVDQDMWLYLCKLKMYSTYINFSFLKIKIHIKIIWQLSTLVRHQCGRGHSGSHLLQVMKLGERAFDNCIYVYCAKRESLSHK